MQVACHGDEAVDDYALAQMLMALPALRSLALRLPLNTLSLASLRALAGGGSLRQLLLDVRPPVEPSLLLRELSGCTSLERLTLGPVFGPNCSAFPGVLHVLRDLRAALPTCAMQQCQ